MIGVGKGGGSPGLAKKDQRPAWAAGATEELSYDTIRAFVALFGSDADRALFSFAESRELTVSGSDWREKVLITAGMEHPDLASALGTRKPQSRGRPPKPVNRLLAVAQPRDAEALAFIEMLDSVNGARRRAGRSDTLSDTKFAEALARHRGSTGGELFVSAVQVMKNRLSTARKIAGRQLKPRKKRK